jgi:hypothetical protein
MNIPFHAPPLIIQPSNIVPIIESAPRGTSIGDVPEKLSYVASKPMYLQAPTNPPTSTNQLPIVAMVAMVAVVGLGFFAYLVFRK